MSPPNHGPNPKRITAHFKYYFTELAKKRHVDAPGTRTSIHAVKLKLTGLCFSRVIVCRTQCQPCLQEGFPCHPSAAQPVTGSSVALAPTAATSSSSSSQSPSMSLPDLPLAAVPQAAATSTSHTSDPLCFQLEEPCRSFPLFSLSVDERHTPEESRLSASISSGLSGSEFYSPMVISFSPFLSVLL